jgi:hypothetical protein
MKSGNAGGIKTGAIKNDKANKTATGLSIAIF